MPTAAGELTVGFRFRRGDARVLRALVQRGESEGLRQQHLALFRRAAEDARRGEPMRVTCRNLDEARAFAEGFTFYGIRAPVIEAMT